MNFNYQPYLEQIFKLQVAYYTERDAAEKNLSIKQIIPYVLMEANGRLLFYVRGKQGGESRLIYNGSIGIGGHISLKDDSIFHNKEELIRHIYHAAVTREVNEELIIDTAYEDKIIAVLNDDSNSVGQVHFGIIHLWRLKEPNVKKREQNITQLSFLTPVQIRAQKQPLENWTQICLDNIETILGTP